MVRDLTKSICSSTDEFDIICSSKDCAPFMKPKLATEHKAKVVFYPKNKNEIRKILLEYNCVIRGGASTYLGQVIPERNEAIIDMSKLNSIKMMNNSVLVGAGTPFMNIIKKISDYNKELPVFPLSYKSATPGGFLATGGKIGIGSTTYGSFADNIDEIEVITPNSEILKLKGNDISDFSHSEGSLGVISSLKLKLIDKETRYKHMYGFDERIDLARFFDNSKNVHMAYFFNNIAAATLNKKWDIKALPKYTLLSIDNCSKDDHERTFRDDLSKQGISFIYPKWINDLEFSRLYMIDFLVKEDRNKIFIADAIGPVEKAIKVLKYAEKYKFPVFGMFGKTEVLLRFYFNCKDIFDRGKFYGIMNKIHSELRPAGHGKFFKNDFTNTLDWKRIKISRSKYNITKNLSERKNINKMQTFKKIMTPVIIATGGKIW